MNYEYAQSPAELLKEVMDDLILDVWELSEMSGIPAEELEAILQDRQAVTLDDALLLELAIGVPFEQWLDLEEAYQKVLSNLSEDEINRALDNSHLRSIKKYH